MSSSNSQHCLQVVKAAKWAQALCVTLAATAICGGKGMSKQNEFIQSLDGELTPEQIDRLIDGDFEGDTSAQAQENGGLPEASINEGENKSKGEADSSTNEAELSAANAVVMARDGKHTIPFEKLSEAREGEKHWRAQAEAAQQELDGLKAQAQARADAGQAPTQQDNQVAAAEAAIASGVNPELFGDFSEEALAGGIQKLVQQQVEARLQAALAPYEKREAQSATEAHYEAIYQAHPDADSVAHSQELANWINSQPTFVRGSLEAVMQQGSTEQVVELLDAFKSATGATQSAAPSTADAVRSAANKAVANAREEVPASLSDFPGGRAGANSRDEAMHDMSSGIELSEAMREMTEEQIEQFLNRL